MLKTCFIILSKEKRFYFHGIKGIIRTCKTCKNNLQAEKSISVKNIEKFDEGEVYL